MGQTLIATKGLPGSGKSTWAKEHVLKHPGKFKRVNKDDLRAMLDAGKWSKANEREVVKTRDRLVKSFLTDGFSVIVDDTHLEGSHLARLEQIAREFGAAFEVKDFTDVPLEVCIQRDLKRLASVGKDVIMRMYDRGIRPAPPDPPAYDPELPDCVIVDMDGTWAIMCDRSPYDESRCAEDTVNQAVDYALSALTAADPTLHVIVMSGRDEGRGRAGTELWLSQRDTSHQQLHMRPAGDTRHDSIIKRELYEAHVKGRYNVRLVLDDRDQVVELWRRELGLPCFQVAYGNF